MEQMVEKPVEEIREQLDVFRKSLAKTIADHTKDFGGIIREAHGLLKEAETAKHEVAASFEKAQEAEDELQKAMVEFDGVLKQREESTKKIELIKLLKATYDLVNEWRSVEVELESKAADAVFVLPNITGFAHRFASLERSIQQLPRYQGKKTSIQCVLGSEMSAVRKTLRHHVETVLQRIITIEENGNITVNPVRMGSKGSMAQGCKGYLAGLEIFEILDVSQGTSGLAEIAHCIDERLLPHLFQDSDVSVQAPKPKDKQQPSLVAFKCQSSHETSNRGIDALISRVEKLLEFVYEHVLDKNVSKFACWSAVFCPKLWDRLEASVTQYLPADCAQLKKYSSTVQSALSRLHKLLQGFDSSEEHSLFNTSIESMIERYIAHQESHYLNLFRENVEMMWNDFGGINTINSSSNSTDAPLLAFPSCKISSFSMAILDHIDDIAKRCNTACAVNLHEVAIALVRITRTCLLTLPSIINQKHRKAIISDVFKSSLLHNDMLRLAHNLLSAQTKFLGDDGNVLVSFVDVAAEYQQYAKEVLVEQVNTQVDVISGMCCMWKHHFHEMFVNRQHTPSNADDPIAATVVEAVILARSLASTWQTTLCWDLHIECVQRVVNSAFEAVISAILSFQVIEDEDIPHFQKLLHSLAPLTTIKVDGHRIFFKFSQKFQLLFDLLEMAIDDIEAMFKDGNLSDFSGDELESLVLARFDSSTKRERFLNLLKK